VYVILDSVDLLVKLFVFLLVFFTLLVFPSMIADVILDGSNHSVTEHSIALELENVMEMEFALVTKLVLAMLDGWEMHVPSPIVLLSIIALVMETALVLFNALVSLVGPVVIVPEPIVHHLIIAM